MAPPSEPQNALQTLAAAEMSAHDVADSAALMLGTLQASLQTVSAHPPALSTHASVHVWIGAQLTSNTFAHMSVHRDAAEHTMQAALEGIAHARTLIAKCRQLDAEMVHVEALAVEIKAIKQTLTTLEATLDLQR